jgi:hypothetical protein
LASCLAALLTAVTDDQLENVVPMPEGHRRRDEPYCVPRRFGIGTIMIVTAAYGSLLAAMTYNGVPRIASAGVVVFVSAIGLGQVLLFRGKKPREASILTGVVTLNVMAIAYLIFGPRTPYLAAVVMSVFPILMVGSLLGYLGGGIVAGVFLVMDLVESALPERFKASSPTATGLGDRHPSTS